MKAIRVNQCGGPEVLKYVDTEVPAPQKGEALVQIEAIGVNFIDVYYRTGLYPLPLPFIPGSEAAGVVEAVGPEVTNVKVGDRVVYVMAPGTYAEKSSPPAWRLVPIPEGMDSRNAAAALLQGLTVHYLCRGAYHLKAGDTALVHAAAGGVGRLLVQAAKSLGANVIGTVSNPEKAKIAKEAGADETILYTQQDFAAETKRITSGRGVDVVYDSVGQTTFERNLECIRPRGMIVLFGQSSGPVPPFNLSLLAARGSLFVTRPSLAHYTSTREELMQRSQELFEWLKRGTLNIRIDHEYPLAEAAEAHRRLESRASSGKILLYP